MIAIYKFLTAVIYTLIHPYALSRADEDDKLWAGRIGRVEINEEVDIWLHAASVGEVKVISYLIDYLKQKKTTLKIHATAMTRTGYKTAEAMLKNQASLSFFPLDASRPLKKVLDLLKPKIIVIAETEIWPNLITTASKRGIKLILVNGRMSSKSFGKYKLIKGTLKFLLAKYDHFFFKSPEDKKRYESFSIPDAKSIVSGDMKFDAPLSIISEGRKRELRSRLGVNNNQFLFIAGSTRDGEEKILIESIPTIKESINGYKLAIAPRHLERVNEIISLCNNNSIKYHLYSDSIDSSEGMNDKDIVIIVNRMGILNDLYMAADLSFVGGSLVNIGGHNILEPVWSRTAVLFGPYISNVNEAAEHIINNNYGMMVNTPGELTQTIISVAKKEIIFNYRHEQNIQSSATAIAGDYILGLHKSDSR